jgi:hypothetical protein
VKTTTREERIRLLHDCIERQTAERTKLLRDLTELDEATRRTCGEYMELVAPRPSSTKETTS